MVVVVVFPIESLAQTFGFFTSYEWLENGIRGYFQGTEGISVAAWIEEKSKAPLKDSWCDVPTECQALS